MEDPIPAGDLRASAAADIIRVARMSFGFIELASSRSCVTRVRLHHTFTATDPPAPLPRQDAVLRDAGVQHAVRLLCDLYDQTDALFVLRVQNGELRHLEVDIGVAA